MADRTTLLATRLGANRLGALCAGLTLAIGCFGTSRAALGQTVNLKVLLDLDNNPATGCVITTPSGVFNGAEHVLITTVDLASYTVTAVQDQACVSGVLGTPVALSGPYLPPWPVGPSNGASGSTLIETYFPLSLSAFVAPSVRVGFVVSDAGGDEDAILPSTPIPTDGAATRIIPALSAWGVILLSGSILFVGLVLLRRRRGSAVATLGVVLLLTGLAGVAWAAVALDGQASDWAGISPLSAKPPSTHPSHPELLAVYGVEQGGNLFFRADTLLPVIRDISSVTMAPSFPGSSDYSSSPLFVSFTPVLNTVLDPNKLIAVEFDYAFDAAPTGGIASFEVAVVDAKGTSVCVFLGFVSPVAQTGHLTLTLNSPNQSAFTTTSTDPAKLAFIDVIANGTTSLAVTNVAIHFNQ